MIVIAVHANPDGMQMVSKCYMQNAEPAERRTCSPRLYEKYAGHDNNRDFYMSNTRESQNMNKLMYWEWLPQIMYNHHQTGPAGTVLFSPPFRDPFNYNFDPMIVTGLDMVGAHMHHRFLQEGKPGFTMRSGSSYSTWWNGGLRTTAYFQNIIGLLTEIIGNPTPTQIPAVPGFILPRADIPGADRAAGMALPPVDRLLGHRQLRGLRSGLALQGSVPLQHLQDGIEPDRARLPRSLDDFE